MNAPSKSIITQSSEKISFFCEPKFSFISFLDENNTPFFLDENNQICQYENDRDKSFEYPYLLKINFDEFKKIKNKYNLVPGCKRFWRRFSQCKRIYIVDKFFEIDNYLRLLNELKIISQCIDYHRITIKIITQNVAALQNISIDGINVEIYFARQDSIDKYLKYIHDRFVWLDGEIWHFGAAAGGMSPRYKAVSGGWDDIDNSFEKLCKNFF